MLSDKDRARLFTKIGAEDENGCWPWLLAPQGKAEGPKYGRFWSQNRQVVAHRVVYELLIGPVPDGLTLDHLCRNTMCVNPNHLEPVTSKENSLRGTNPFAENARKTHCQAGHPLSGDNLKINSQGNRMCRACAKAYFAARYEQQKASQ